MLVLTQKEGEILQVGDDVRIYIKRIKGNWVRLCIDAPRDVVLKRIPAPRQLDESTGHGAQASDRDGSRSRVAAADYADTQVVRISRRRRAEPGDGSR
jgi:carbon storage regulator